MHSSQYGSFWVAIKPRERSGCSHLEKLPVVRYPDFYGPTMVQEFLRMD